MKSRFLLAVIAAAMTAFFGGWLIFGVLLPDYYNSNINTAALLLMKRPTELWAVAIANLSWALLLTWVLQKTGSISAMSGFATSLWVSFLVILTFDLSIYAFWDLYTFGFLIIDIVISSLFWAVVGAVAGGILGLRRKVPVAV